MRRGTSRRTSPSPGSTSSASMPLLRLPGDEGPGDLTDAQVDARRRIGEALDALGGRQPCWLMRMAHRRTAAIDPRMGDAAALGPTAGTDRAGARDPGGGAGTLAGHYGYGQVPC